MLLFLTYPKIKSDGVKSGDRAAHFIGSLRPIHLPSKFFDNYLLSLKKNVLELHLA